MNKYYNYYKNECLMVFLFSDKLLIKKFIMEKMQLEKTLEMFTLNMKFNPNKLSIVEGTVSYEDVNKFNK